MKRMTKSALVATSVLLIVVLTVALCGCSLSDFPLFGGGSSGNSTYGNFNKLNIDVDSYDTEATLPKLRALRWLPLTK